MKKTETKTIEKYYCDICGKEADGNYLAEIYLNGKPHSTYDCPFDLCKYHADKFDTFVDVSWINVFMISNDDLLGEFTHYLKASERKNKSETRNF